MLLEVFTDSLCSKPPPPRLDILCCKVQFFKTWISVVSSTVFLKKIENHKFSIFFSSLVPKMSHIFENDSNFWISFAHAQRFQNAISEKSYVFPLLFILLLYGDGILFGISCSFPEKCTFCYGLHYSHDVFPSLF